MGILSWILMGLIAGAIAKWIMPGKDGGGCLLTMALGIAGAIVGGFIGSFFGLAKVDEFSLATMGIAVGGAVVILVLYRAITKK
ncbi:MAG: putative membrane protein YeaQ/YmgE (transglycosylase-associated protein family) [Gammaproteobacteria bacterium]|jgi:uncharacterized membrane protein YeaQ/YmgE (transglycosylase-associated protein family)